MFMVDWCLVWVVVCIVVVCVFFFFKQKTAYEMRISDWSSDVCSSDLFEFGGSASISYGTFDRKEGVFDVTGPLSDTVAVRFTGVLRDSDSRMDYTPNDRQLAQASITWRPSDRTDITAIGIYQHDKKIGRAHV